MISCMKNHLKNNHFQSVYVVALSMQIKPFDLKNLTETDRRMDGYMDGRMDRQRQVDCLTDQQTNIQQTIRQTIREPG